VVVCGWRFPSNRKSKCIKFNFSDFFYDNVQIVEQNRYTHQIPPLRKRKEVVSSSGNMWINSTFFKEVEKDERKRNETDE